MFRTLNFYENIKTFDKGRLFKLVDSESKEKEFIVVDGMPDPLNGVISSESEVGKKLLKLKVGGKIEIGPVEYKVLEVEDCEF